MTKATIDLYNFFSRRFIELWVLGLRDEIVTFLSDKLAKKKSYSDFRGTIVDSVEKEIFQRA